MKLNRINTEARQCGRLNTAVVTKIAELDAFLLDLPHIDHKERAPTQSVGAHSSFSFFYSSHVLN